MNCSRTRSPLSIICIILLLLSCLDIRLLAEVSYAADNSYISDVVFWDAGNRCEERHFGFDPENTDTYEVPIDDNTGAIKVRIFAADHLEEDIYAQMMIGDTVGEPVKMASGEMTEISTPVTSELVGKAFRIGAKKTGALVVGQYDTETGSWAEDSVNYSFSFIRRIVLNSVSIYDVNNNKLALDPLYIDPNCDEYTVGVPDTSNIIRFVPSLTIKSTVRDEEDPEGINYAKIIDYNVPDGAIISNNNGTVIDISKLDLVEGKPFIDVAVGYNKEESDIQTSTYRFLLSSYEVQSEADHTPDAVIMESESEITCDKNEDVELKVSAEVTGEANLTYRWLYGYDENSVNTVLEESESNTIHPSTLYAWTKYYRCCVINTVNGKKYYKYSGIFKVKVNLSYVTEPMIYGFVEDEELFVGAEKYFEISAQGYDEGVTLSYKWFTNDKDDTDGANEIQLTPHKYGLTPDRYGLYRFDECGEFYIYCVVTASKDGKSAESRSDFVKVTVKEPDGLSGLKGDGTENDPYRISSVDSLEQVKRLIAEGYYFQNKYFIFTEDIELPVDWEPIGRLKDGKNDAGMGVNIQPFSGNIDGYGHTVTVAEGGKPLFGYVREASIKNLKIYGRRVNGYGLIDNYTVDYGNDGTYDTGAPVTCNIENVTILSGSSVLKSGFLGGYASGANTVNISNCTVQEGVTIGYDKSESNIGSFSGDFNGTITNSYSAADVYGVNKVGGLIGKKGQSMGLCTVTNCYFTGIINATGNKIGGIIGSGYGAESAPNVPVAVINNCFVTADIVGNDEVGGILGSEPGVEVAWGNGTGGVQNSFYYGKITATGTNVGGIIGYYNSLDKFQTITNNFYLETSGVAKGIGKLKKIITVAEDSQFGREDDFDAERACSAASAEAFADGTVLAKLNSGEGSYQNWRQDEKYPVFGEEAVPVELTVSRYIEEYLIGDTFDTFGMGITVRYSDGSVKAVDPSEVQFSGFDSVKVGQKTITATYGPISTTFEVSVVYNDAPEILVRLIIIGDMIHGGTDEVHTLKGGGLKKWLDEDIVINMNMSVKDLLLAGLERLELDHKGAFYPQYDSYYVSGIQIPGSGDYLEEFSNGALSGWMYHVNGYYPDRGVDRYYPDDGDIVVFHYTDDYTMEESIGSDGAGYGEDLEFYPPKDEPEDPEEEARKQLEQAKANAKTILSNYKNLADYRTAEQAQISEIIASGKAAIDAAETQEAVAALLAEYKGKFDAVKTDAQLTEEETQAAEEAAARKLKEARNNAKVELGLYMAPEEYRDAEKALLLEILAEGEAAINAASTEEAVKALLAEYKAKIDELKTDAEYTAEEEAAHREEERKKKEHKAAMLAARIKAARAAKPKVTVKALKKHKAKVTWKKVALSYTVDGKKYTGSVTGYKIYRATKKTGKYKLIKTIKKAGTLKYTDKKLKKGRKYFYKVRTYTRIDGKNYLGKWSKARGIRAR